MLTRAIRAGRLSAGWRDDGGYEIDLAELARVFIVTPETPDTGLAARFAAAEARIEGLHALTVELRAELERADRAERLLTDQRRRPWWRRLVG